MAITVTNQEGQLVPYTTDAWQASGEALYNSLTSSDFEAHAMTLVTSTGPIEVQFCRDQNSRDIIVVDGHGVPSNWGDVPNRMEGRKIVNILFPDTTLQTSFKALMQEVTHLAAENGSLQNQVQSQQHFQDTAIRQAYEDGDLRVRDTELRASSAFLHLQGKMQIYKEKTRSLEAAQLRAQNAASQSMANLTAAVQAHIAGVEKRLDEHDAALTDIKHAAAEWTP